MEIFLSNRKFKPRFFKDIFSQKISIEISSSSEFLAVGLFLFLDHNGSYFSTMGL